MDKATKEVLEEGFQRMKTTSELMKTARIFSTSGEAMFDALSGVVPNVQEFKDAASAFNRLTMAVDDVRAQLTRVTDRVEVELEKNA